MNNGLWGKKVGITQIFDNHKVIPVTVIDTSHWVVTQIKRQAKEGYEAVQLGYIKPKFRDAVFSADWLRNPKVYFSVLREVRLDQVPETATVGEAMDLSFLVEGDKVNAHAKSKGRGFAGVVKRHGFTGAKGSHGNMMGKRPGSIGFMRTQGEVIKGKRLPGHMGCQKVVLRNLKVIKIDNEARVLLVNGSVPGNIGSLVYLKKVN
jgi:large subunit ribosomal protein L3